MNPARLASQILRNAAYLNEVGVGKGGGDNIVFFREIIFKYC